MYVPRKLRRQRARARMLANAHELGSVFLTLGVFGVTGCWCIGCMAEIIRDGVGKPHAREESSYTGTPEPPLPDYMASVPDALTDPALTKPGATPVDDAKRRLSLLTLADRLEAAGRHEAAEKWRRLAAE